MDLPNKMKATQILVEDHLKAKHLYQKFLEAEDTNDRASLAEELCKELEIHARLEECLFYPELAKELPDNALLMHFGQQHGEVKRLISEWRLGQEEKGAAMTGEQMLLARLMTVVQEHVAEEEDRALSILEADPDRDEALGAALAKLKLKLKMFPPIHRRIELEVPVRVAYNQWTQFEAFPHFLDNVKEVRQLDEAHVQWQVEVAGKELQWVAEIYEQIPDQRIAWTSVGGSPNAGSVTFRPLSPTRTCMLVEIAYEPQGILEDLGAMMGFLSRRLETELEKFKAYLEAHARETGAWRGTIEGNPIEPQL